MKPVALVAFLIALVPASGRAQTATLPAGPAGPLPALTATPAHIPLGTRVGEPATGYDDGGRRDPFVSLVIAKKSAVRNADVRPRSGLAALLLADVVVSGIAINGDLRSAVLEGPNRRSFVIRVKDQIGDAVVTRIERDAVTFTELSETGQPMAPVRRPVRGSAEGAR